MYSSFVIDHIDIPRAIFDSIVECDNYDTISINNSFVVHVDEAADFNFDVAVDTLSAILIDHNATDFCLNSGL